jgi:hypothetical protein
MPNGELLGSGRHAAIFDRSMTSSRDTVYACRSLTLRFLRNNVAATSCSAQLDGVQTPNFRFRQRGVGLLPREKRIRGGDQRAHGQTVRFIVKYSCFACALVPDFTIFKVRSSNCQMWARAHSVQHLGRSSSEQVQAAQLQSSPLHRFDRLSRGQAGCVSISNQRARMIVLTPSSFSGFSAANLRLLQ